MKKEVENIIGLDMTDAIPVSAKTGQNVEEVLKRIVEQVPPPPDNSRKPCAASFSIPFSIPTKGPLPMSG